MKKSTKKPNAQYLSGYGDIRDSCGIEMDTPYIFKPVKLLAIPRLGLVCLMTTDASNWIVYSLDTHGVAARSTIYRSKAFGESAWTELCDELTTAAKNNLASVALDPKLTGQERGDAASALARLEMADDEKYEGITEKARQFVATHTPAECEARIKAELERCNAMRASDGEEE